nr:uncharacterized protein CTRU02_11121 [Colletotrichum truncatum]KAF6786250.1 hypothetical protein CTRU02_11121 [Colletotrichum truncatum]
MAQLFKRSFAFVLVPGYKRIASRDDEDATALNGSMEPCRHEKHILEANVWSLPALKAATALNICLFFLSLAMLVANGIAIPSNSGRESQASGNWFLKQVSRPSPLLEEGDIPFFDKKLDATLLLNEPVSIYRQEPSLKVDIAWDRLGDLRLIPLSREDVESMGKDPEDAVKFPPEWGLGDDVYAGRLDVFHQIHCLDALRRESYFEHYYGESYPKGYNQTGEMHRLHLSHCIWYLLQSIMCQATTDVYTHIWTDGVEHPFPDFSAKHKCRDYGAIKKYQNEHAVSVEPFVALKAPPGAKVHRMTRHFKELHGFFDVHEDDGNHGDEIA